MEVEAGFARCSVLISESAEAVGEDPKSAQQAGRIGAGAAPQLKRSLKAAEDPKQCSLLIAAGQGETTWEATQAARGCSPSEAGEVEADIRIRSVRGGSQETQVPQCGALTNSGAPLSYLAGARANFRIAKDDIGTLLGKHV